jgi:ABC-2 type transport system ATP-binding protein
MSDTAVHADALRVVRGKNLVLNDLDFDVHAGRIIGLLGPSGCGKTTLLRSIVGSQKITSGSLVVLGLPAGDPSLRTSIGYATQQASVYLDLTVAQNVAYFAAAVRAPADDVDRVIDEVDLRSFTRRLAGQLSGGQRSRVSLAVALLGQPQLLVLDEPTVGLDPVLREDLWDLFARLVHSGMTLIVSSHVMDEAQRCDDILLMRDGQLLARGAPNELMDRTGTRDMDAAFLALVAS